MAKADPLASYNAKRDFRLTREPKGERADKTGHMFIVQKHDATRLHWDFRLEMDGVLKSWAVTKGPSADPAERRLAVRTEDHPLAYAQFEGTIPKGEYGGGTVMLWDRGTWAPVAGKSEKDLEEGHLHFRLEGERMKGEWLLVRMKGRAGEKRENWLLRKIDDDEAGKGDGLIERGLTSVVTGRSMAQIAADAQGEQSLKGVKGKAFAKKMRAAAEHVQDVAENQPKPKARSRQRKRGTDKLPDFVPPQLATLVDAVPQGSGWMHEIKFDGYRALIACAGDKVTVYTRNGLDWTSKFGPLVRAIAQLDLPSCLIDGEIVAYGKDGNPDFSSLQAVLKRGHGAQTEATPLSFFAFDLLALEGEDLRSLTNIERKERLAGLLHAAKPPVQMAEHILGAGEKLFEAMCSAGQEGIISKRIDAPYRSERTRAWVKVKCTLRQEFVIVGWKKSSAKGRPFSSLLLGQNEEGKLRFKGKVGTGFDQAKMSDLMERMARLTSERPAVEDVPRPLARGVTWLKPDLVAEIAFAEFTADGQARHASFLGLRGDKRAKDVQPEIAAPAAALVSPVAISSRERVIFPETGETKGDLADYYLAIAPLMLPFAARRPLSLVRCPQGRARQCFFQKHDSGAFGEHVKPVSIAEKDGGAEDYLYIEDEAGLMACVQMGTIEFHAWGAKTEAVERPDHMVFDLDPDVALDFGDVRSAARHLHDRLAELGLVSFAMLSGGKGVHVIVPLAPGHDWETHKDFARRFAEALSMAEPERFIATMSKAKRKGRIFIDYLRNQRGSTSVLPYSARAREGAPVAAPISWDELGEMDNAHRWSIRDQKELIDRASSPALNGWGFADQKLPEI